jgi:hypothetical protein
MEMIQWTLSNFGLFFGGVFLVYLFLMIRRLIILYDILRFVPRGEDAHLRPGKSSKALLFLNGLFARYEAAATGGAGGEEAVADAIWSEVDCRVTIHFTALNGYVNTVILIGFAGTIFGSIGAFNEMFRGLAHGQAAAMVFVASWNRGLSTALYTSLAAAAISGSLITLLCSRFFMARAKRLETMVGLRISELLEEKIKWGAEEKNTAWRLREPRTREKTSSPTCSS